MCSFAGGPHFIDFSRLPDRWCTALDQQGETLNQRASVNPKNGFTHSQPQLMNLLIRKVLLRNKCHMGLSLFQWGWKTFKQLRHCSGYIQRIFIYYFLSYSKSKHRPKLQKVTIIIWGHAVVCQEVGPALVIWHHLFMVYV